MIVNKMNADDIWSRLESSELRKSLDSESLKIIEPLLANKDSSNLALKDDKLKLGKIYSYVEYEKLFKTNFRKKLFNYFYDDELFELRRLLEIKTRKREEIIQALVAIKWSSNERAKIISNFIGVPSWILDLHQDNISSTPEKSIPWHLKYQTISEQNFDKREIQSNLAERKTFKRLKSYQNIVYSDAMEKLSPNNSRIILNMPTGTGKTRTCMELVSAFLRENPNKSVVWLADKVELIDQACLEFHDTWEYLGDRKIPIRRWVKASPIGDEGKSEFICATFGTLLSRGDGLKKINIGMVVIDEAHKAVAEKWKEKMETTVIQPRNSTRVVGLTATPQRATDKESEELVEFFHNNRITIKEQGGRNLMDWLEENEYLSMANNESIKAEVEMELTDKERKKLEDIDSDYSLTFLIKLASKFLFNVEITKKLRALLEENPKHRILYFGTTVHQSRMIMSWLRINGYTAFHIDANTDPNVRKAAIEAFRNGRLQVLCNWGVLTTGFDAPLTDVVVIARPTSSAVTYHQMVGRGLRGPRLGGSPKCKIIDVDFNLSNHGTKRKHLYKYYRELWSAGND